MYRFLTQRLLYHKICDKSISVKEFVEKIKVSVCDLVFGSTDNDISVFLLLENVLAVKLSVFKLLTVFIYPLEGDSVAVDLVGRLLRW